MKPEDRKAHREFLQPQLMALDSGHETSWILDYLATLGLDDFASQRKKLEEIVLRKKSGEPLAYIFGSWSFRGHEIFVTQDTLIPRPETEELVESVLMSLENSNVSSERILKSGLRFADLGAGSGCIGLVSFVDLLQDVETETGRAQEISRGFELFLVEQSREACVVIERNIAALRSKLYDSKVKVLCQNWNDFDERNLDVVVSNPPYITPEEYKNLDASVKNFEPKEALLCADVLSPYKEVIEVARRSLVPGGWLFVELGVAQGERVQEYVSGDASFNEIRTLKDIAKKPRFFCARKARED